MKREAPRQSGSLSGPNYYETTGQHPVQCVQCTFVWAALPAGELIQNKYFALA